MENTNGNGYGGLPAAPKQQIIETLKGAERVLITSHENPDGDSLGSALALAHVLRQLNKQVTVAMSGRLDPTCSFLPGFATVKKEIASEQEFLVVLDETQTKAKNVELRRLDDQRLAVVLIPENGAIDAQKITFEKGRYPYDCVVVLDTPKIDLVGAIYSENQPLFKDVTTLSLDHHLEHTSFATHNLSDTKAAATAEIMVSIIESLGQSREKPVNLIDETVATCLLTGLMTDTGSFQNSNTTPKSLTVAAQMLASRAHHNQIVRDVFKSRPASQLRLWGKALTQIKEDKPLRFAWTTLTRADFTSTGATEDEVTGLIDTLLKTATNTDFVLLLSERQDHLHGSLRSIKEGVDVQKLATIFGGGGHQQAAAFIIDKGSIAEHETRIINAIRDERRRTATPVSPTPSVSPDTPNMTPEMVSDQTDYPTLRQMENGILPEETADVEFED